MSPGIRPFFVLAGAVLAAIAVVPGFLAMHARDTIVRGPGVTSVSSLSAYHQALADTPGDTAIYDLRGSGPGGTVLVLGGTHADEPAGYLAAVVLVEQALVGSGRLLVIPRANASGFTHNYPQEGHPASFTVATPWGPRQFTYGARATNPVHQWPDPQVYSLPDSGQTLSGSETRNLNRAYPGRADGTFTEQIAFAITTLIDRERVDLALDLHEASPEYPVVNTMVAHQRAVDLAAVANMTMQGAGVTIGLETSPENLHGLSHREWGDATGALAVLMETTNPAQGRLRGRTDADLVLNGRDRFYVLASSRGGLSVPFPDSGWPLSMRVARHLAGVAALVGALGEVTPHKAVVLAGVPDYETVVMRGVGAFLRKP
jgi:predicted deacylase